MEDNRLIAEFMGWNEEESGCYPDVPMRLNDRNQIEQPGPYQGDTPLKMLHISWDWLMPVAKKCFLELAEGNRAKQLEDAILSMEINEIYGSTVDFIKWHNEKKLS